jgi:hypothetical protein
MIIILLSLDITLYEGKTCFSQPEQNIESNIKEEQEDMQQGEQRSLSENLGFSRLNAQD